MDPQSKAGFVGVDDVKKMLKDMKSQNCDRGVFISKRFTAAAAEEMANGKIQQVSDGYMPPVKPENLYLAISDSVDNLCKAKCSLVPAKRSDCRSWAEGNTCRVREISNNAAFHFERGWISLLNDDLRQLLSLPKSAKSAVASAKKSSDHSCVSEV
jgi:hypothetical protein